MLSKLYPSLLDPSWYLSLPVGCVMVALTEALLKRGVTLRWKREGGGMEKGRGVIHCLTLALSIESYGYQVTHQLETWLLQLEQNRTFTLLEISLVLILCWEGLLQSYDNQTETKIPSQIIFPISYLIPSPPESESTCTWIWIHLQDIQ